MIEFYYFGIEIEAIIEPHNKGKPIQGTTKESLRVWYDKLAAALRRREGTDRRRLKATAQSNLKKYRQETNRHIQWWITWDGSLVKPEWPKHPGGN